MMVMKGMKILSVILMAIVIFSTVNAQNESSRTGNQVIVSVPDTIVRTDTIVVREEIIRTDIVYRTEKVVRHEETKTSGSEIIVRGSEISQPAGDALQQKAAYPSLASSPGEESLNNGLNPGESQPKYYQYPDGSVMTVLSNEEFSAPESPEGGNFIWVPDSMDRAVLDLLHGKQTFSSGKAAGNFTEEDFNPNEKVIFRGDTLPMILKDRNLGRYDRGLFNFLYIPKGMWQVGATASYGEFSTSDLQILDLVSDIDFYGHIFSVRPYFSYFLKNNVSLGLRLGFTEGKAHIGAFNVDIDDDMSFNLHDIMYRSQNYSASITLTQYLGITRKGRFGVFNEVELAFAGGASDFHRPYNGEMRKTHTNIFEAGLNFSPGISVFIVEPLSFNVSFGVFGLNLRHEKQKVNDEPSGERTTSGANFRFNIFNINFGIAVNI